MFSISTKYTEKSRRLYSVNDSHMTFSQVILETVLGKKKKVSWFPHHATQKMDTETQFAFDRDKVFLFWVELIAQKPTTWANKNIYIVYISHHTACERPAITTAFTTIAQINKKTKFSRVSIGCRCENQSVANSKKLSRIISNIYRGGISLHRTANDKSTKMSFHGCRKSFVNS
jgi:hypothetical protein